MTIFDNVKIIIDANKKDPEWCINYLNRVADCGMVDTHLLEPLYPRIDKENAIDSFGVPCCVFCQEVATHGDKIGYYCSEHNRN